MHNQGAVISDHSRSGGFPADADAERVSQLERGVEERDQLITALTVQLEEACERIDRMQRMGADRGPVSMGGMPRELVEDQKTVLDELQEAVRRWEEVQAAAALGRIEMQIGELRDLVVERLRGGVVQSAPEPEEPSEPPDDAPTPTWSTMRDSLLASTNSSDGTDDGGSDSASIDSLGEWVDPPPAIAADASADALRLAVEERDDYVIWLIRRLRSVESSREMLLGGVDADSAPEEVQRRIAELERAFDEKQRLVEVELSIERARLAREGARLKVLDEQIQKEAKRLGMQNGQPRAPEPPADSESGKSRRWRRMLGMRDAD